MRLWSISKIFTFLWKKKTCVCNWREKIKNLSLRFAEKEVFGLKYPHWCHGINFSRIKFSCCIHFSPLFSLVKKKHKICATNIFTIYYLWDSEEAKHENQNVLEPETGDQDVRNGCAGNKCDYFVFLYFGQTWFFSNNKTAMYF